MNQYMLVAVTWAASISLALPAVAQPLTGRVVDEAGKPLGGAKVLLSGTPAGSNPVSAREAVVTGPDGRFSVPQPEGVGDLYIGAGMSRYVNTAGFLNVGTTNVGDIALDSMPFIDNEGYTWIPPFFPKEDQSDFGCNLCHGEQRDAWKDSLMAQSARDPFVLSLYSGTDLDGNPAGPGYRLDHPDKAGPCANCHAPAAAANAPNETVLTDVAGVAQEGVFCDVCHKVQDVVVDGGPGVGGSLQLCRPSAWTGLFAFGPFVNAFGMPMTTSYNETLTTSRFCAGCHEWTNEHGTPVLSTYSEWAEMSGADPDALQCQDCHMKKKFGTDYTGEPDPYLKFILDDPMQQQMHGIRRWSDTTFPHTFHGAKEIAAEAAAVDVTATQEGTELVVKVMVDNVNAGHALPTGMPFRHAILVVQATGPSGELAQVAGGQVPDYGGVGDAAEDLAGRPGKGYARVLGDGAGGRNVSFWDATEVIEDTRLRAAQSEELTFRFTLPAGEGQAWAHAQLVYRRAFRELNLAKKWGMEDQVIADDSAGVSYAEPTDEPAQPDTGGQPDAGGGAETTDTVGGDRGDGCSGGGDGDRGPSTPGWLLAAALVAFRARRRRA